jgi:hypothetical protein
VYVNNQLLSRSIPSQGSIYVDVQEFLTATKLTWEVRGNTLYITPGTSGRPRITAVPANYCFNGNPFFSHTFMVGGRPLTQVRALANALGLSERYTPAVNAYDYYSRGFNIPVREAAVKPTTPSMAPTSASSAPVSPTEPTSQAKPAATTGGQKVTFKNDLSKSAIQPKVESTNAFNYLPPQGNVISSPPYQADIVYINTSKDKIGSISVLFKIVDGAGQVIYSTTHTVGELAAGKKSAVYQVSFTNPSNFQITNDMLKYEVSYVEPVKQAKPVQGKPPAATTPPQTPPGSVPPPPTVQPGQDNSGFVPPPPGQSR